MILNIDSLGHHRKTYFRMRLQTAGIWCMDWCRRVVVSLFWFAVLSPTQFDCWPEVCAECWFTSEWGHSSELPPHPPWSVELVRYQPWMDPIFPVTLTYHPHLKLFSLLCWIIPPVWSSLVSLSYSADFKQCSPCYFDVLPRSKLFFSLVMLDYSTCLIFPCLSNFHRYIELFLWFKAISSPLLWVISS